MAITILQVIIKRKRKNLLASLAKARGLVVGALRAPIYVNFALSVARFIALSILM